MDLDQHDSAERCCVEVLPGSVAAHRHFMVDRLEDKVRARATAMPRLLVVLSTSSATPS